MEFIWFTIGVIWGSIVVTIFNLRKRASGTLYIDFSDPEKDIYRLEVDDIATLHKKSRIYVKINSRNADLSHK